MNVSNKKCIRNLSRKNMKSSRLRNIIAVIAIALTTVLFTALFTIVMSVAKGFEQSNFRRAGGYQHGGFKNITANQLEEFKSDPRIKEYGKRVFIGSPSDIPFDKSKVEISSVDENYAKFTFVDFIEGGLPRENTNEAAADTRVLSLLGIAPEIGREFTLTFDVSGKEITEKFTLCGYCEFDGAMPAGSVFLPFDKGEEIFEKTGTVKGKDGITGTISFDFMLKSGSINIEKNMQKIIEDHGYQFYDPGGEGYIGYGVNWGYMGARANNVFDLSAVLGIAAIIALIVFTGYLITYNVFRISVSNDIRYYGLLKAIGTTGTQIKRIILIQALTLSAAGIPAGIAIGCIAGAILSPLVISRLDVVQDSISFSPMIFIGSAAFSLGTVIISCRRPESIAAKISPARALKYIESSGGNAVRKSKKGASVIKMAAANLCRNKSKTAVTVISLALSVLLLNLTVTFTNGFNMDKYLCTMPADIIIADAKYFKVGEGFNDNTVLPESAVSYIAENVDIAEFGRTYGEIKGTLAFAPAEHIIEKESKYFGREEAEKFVRNKTANGDGMYSCSAKLYGMEKFCLDKIKVIEGDISKLYGGENYIAAVYSEDDYGNPVESSHWANVGDKITVVFEDSNEYIYLDTDGNIYENFNDIPEGIAAEIHSTEEHSAEYEVAAKVTVPHALSYRYYGSDSYILGAETFIRDTGTDSVMYAAFDIKDGGKENAEKIISKYTEKIAPTLGYESKKTYEDNFDSFRIMFLILGGVLTFIVGLVGILNFINAVLTGIFARRRELAVLQSVGMTGAQLRKMLVAEGMIYTMGAAVCSLILLIISFPLEKTALEKMFWFFSFKFTVLPIIIIIPVFGFFGAVIPLIACKFVMKKTIVERLREAE